MLAVSLIAATTTLQSNWVVYEPTNPNGKNVVLLSGDEEYRSEEGLPQLAKILAKNGFRCTVLFSLDDDGTINPDRHDNEPGLENLKDADLCVMLLRFREWPDAQMRRFDEYLKSGKPILALRTSTHAFDLKSGPYEKYGWQSKTWPGGFGKHVLGETWVSHWGVHGKQATRGHLAQWVPYDRETVEPESPVMRGVKDVFGTTDVYEANPSSDAQILMYGEVVDGMSPNDPMARGTKKDARGVDREVNSPMMPIAWYRAVGSTQSLTCTMGAATDLLNEGLRRLLVNACYWLLGMPVPAKADVALVGDYKPSPFGFGAYRKGVRPSDLRARGLSPAP